MWRGTIQLPLNRKFEAKVVVVSEDGKQGPRWEPGVNRVLQLQSPSGQTSTNGTGVKPGAGYLVVCHYGLPGFNQVVYRSWLSEDAPALAATVRAMCHFTVPNFTTQLGQSLLIVGSIPQLGGWDPLRGLPMQWQPGHGWQGSLELSSDVDVEAKVVMCDRGRFAWEPGPNRRIRLGQLVKQLAAASSQGEGGGRPMTFTAGSDGSVSARRPVDPATATATATATADAGMDGAGRSNGRTKPPAAAPAAGAGAAAAAAEPAAGGNGSSSSDLLRPPLPEGTTLSAVDTLQVFPMCYWGTADTPILVVPDLRLIREAAPEVRGVWLLGICHQCNCSCKLVLFLVIGLAPHCMHLWATVHAAQHAVLCCSTGMPPAPLLPQLQPCPSRSQVPDNHMAAGGDRCGGRGGA